MQFSSFSLIFYQLRNCFLVVRSLFMPCRILTAALYGAISHVFIAFALYRYMG